MAKQYTSSEIERKVLNYIIKKTKKGYTTHFNPLDVSKEGIADKLNLEIEEVEEAIEKLTGKASDYSTKSLERIESIKPKFVIWLPNTKKGDDIKDALLQSGLAVNGTVNTLYSVLIIIISYIFIFKFTHLKDFLNLETVDDYFFWAVIITAISIPIGNYLGHKWYQVNFMLQKVKGSKYYVYALLIFVAIIFFSIINNWNIVIIISGIAVLTNIALFIYQFIKDSK